MRRAILLLLIIDLAIAGLYLANLAIGSPFELTSQLVELNSEQNIPTWWSTVQLFLAGLLLAAFAYSRFRRADRATWGLLALPLPLLFLSFDEAARFHERLGHLGDAVAPRAAEIGERFHAQAIWTLVLLPVAILGLWVVGMATRRYFTGRGRIVGRFVLGFALLFGSGVILEVFFGSPDSPVLRIVEGFLEETGEMIAGTVLVWAGAEFLASHGYRLVEGGQAPDS